MFCTWVALKKMPGYALISDAGKFLKFPATYNKKEKDPDDKSESFSK